MDNNEIKSELIDILAEQFADSGINRDILEYTDFIDDLGMDSIAFISIIIEIEDLFKITIPDDILLMENFRSVDSIIGIIENIRNAAANNAEKQGDLL